MAMEAAQGAVAARWRVVLAPRVAVIGEQDQALLQRAGVRISIQPKAYELLLFLLRERHRVAVTTAIAALAESRAEVVRDDSRVELAAEHLRQAVRALDALVGRVDVDDLLGEIFASFCIGK